MEPDIPLLLDPYGPAPLTLSAQPAALRDGQWASDAAAGFPRNVMNESFTAPDALNESFRASQ